ncbi:glycosyltransferase family 4 protein [Nonomuraea insulae]|uniref:Glycosyltransferase family 4 protein n=1 Tax=Nonomuraea insulae TaxID=1616787 RepID=A0ABW1D921_9ACTN
MTFSLRVLIVFGGLGRGQSSGAERMAWRTTAQLALRGADVVVLTDATRPPGRTWPACSSPEELAVSRPGWRPDVVHVYDLAHPVHAVLGRDLARRFGARLALTPASAPATWPDRRLGARVCGEAAVVYALTAAEEVSIRPLCRAGVTMVRLPQAPDLVGRPDPVGFRAAYDLSGTIVLFLGRKLASKGYSSLLAAAPLIWRAHPCTTFVFCGPDAEGSATRSIRAVGDRRVRDLGMVDDRTKHDALAACTVLALPTSTDVFPLVFAEAWACGKPVLSGRFDGVEDVVRDGVDGVVVQPRPPAVAEALIRLLSDDQGRAAMGAAGMDRVRREMGWERVAAAVERGYRSGGGESV